MIWLFAGLCWAASAVVLHSQERFVTSGIFSVLAIVNILIYYYKVLN